MIKHVFLFQTGSIKRLFIYAIFGFDADVSIPTGSIKRLFIYAIFGFDADVSIPNWFD